MTNNLNYSPLLKKEIVSEQDNTSWKPVTVLSNVYDRSYVVKAPNGGIYRRNWRHVMKTSKQTYTFHLHLPILAETQTDDSVLSPISTSQSKSPPLHPNPSLKICQHAKPVTSRMFHAQAESVFPKLSIQCKLTVN